MPALEHWLNFEAAILIANALFAAWLSISGLRPNASQQKRLFVRLVTAFFAITLAVLAARQIAERSQAEDDFLYFVPWKGDGSVVQFYRNSSGPLEKVRIWIMQSADYPNDSDPDYFSKGIRQYYDFVNAGIQVAGVVLPPGDWTIDIDPKNPRGQVRQRLTVNFCDGEIVFVTTVVRKVDGKVLIAPPSPSDHSRVSLCQ